MFHTDKNMLKYRKNNYQYFYKLMVSFFLYLQWDFPLTNIKIFNRLPCGQRILKN